MSSMKSRDDDSLRLRLLSLLAAIAEDWEAAKKNAAHARQVLKESGPAELRAAAAATFLVRFYTGVEQVFQQIAQEFDGGLPVGAAWHRDLLMAMAREIPTSRPALLTAELRDMLDEYRKFGHRVMHAYGADLDWEAMRPLVERVEDVSAQVQAALERFATFVRAVVE